MKMTLFDLGEISGATPLDDISGLKLSWVDSREKLDAAEADNIRLAINKYLSRKRYAFPMWFTVSHINQVHKLMFSKTWQWAGQYRKTYKSVGIQPYKISVEMLKLEEDIRFWGDKKSYSPLETAARVHHRLVWIHPYENGNGRHARMIGDMVLRAFGHPYIAWPGLNEHGNERKLYIQALKEADHGDILPLLEFLM
jgi:Fic-DOC domain mobile mystery protein B